MTTTSDRTGLAFLRLPDPSEATPGFSSNARALDGSRVRRYSSGQKKRWFKFPIHCRDNDVLGDERRGAERAVRLIGSGTRLAFEDAIALDGAFGEAGGDVPRALKAFERERRPVVEKIIAAANASSYWYERLAEKMMLEPWQLAYDYMTRSGRMTDKRLRELSPEFMVRVDAERKNAP